MEPLLYLVHRIPYPPNKGDKIRSYHLLNYLARHFDVYLGAFVDNPQDWKYIQQLRELCIDVKLIAMRPNIAKLRSLNGLVTGKALTLPYYYSSELQSWVDNTITRFKIQRCIIYSSAMAQYLMRPSYAHLSRIADFVDVDSDKWLQYSSSHTFPLSWLYRREAFKLAEFERKVASVFDAVLFVTDDELAVFQKSTGKTKASLDYYNNGVDTQYFDPMLDFDNPYAKNDKVIIFTGAMDYWANADAVIWFANEVWPQVHSLEINAKFYIVGTNPTVAVKSLAQRKGIHVTGAVQDIRPYLRHAHFAVAPLRIARGVQNKVLEAMAMARHVVATPAAMEGINGCDKYQPAVADSAKAFINACIEALKKNPDSLPVTTARQCIMQQYNWQTNLERLDGYLGIRADSECIPEEC